MTTGKGGYQMVDLKDQNITTTATTIDGVYETVSNNSNKPLLLCNLMVDGTAMRDVWATATESGGTYTITALSGLTMTVTADNAVTMTNTSTLKISARGVTAK